ncbi:MAG: TraR/DksA C4-type zinc finger protein [Phycisphaerales bacterium]
MAKKAQPRGKPAAPAAKGRRTTADAKKPSKSPAKPTATPKASTKKATTKPAAKKPAAKKAAGKKVAKKPAKVTKKPTASKPTVPAAPAKGKPTKAPPAKTAGRGGKAADKPAAKPTTKTSTKAGEKPTTKPAGKAAAPAAEDDKSNRKGITIVSNRPKRPSNKPPKIEMPKIEPLLGPGSPFRKPLIASGPDAARPALQIDADSLAKLKSPFGKRDLAKFRETLLKKRSDLVGDVSDLETEALLGRSGSLSALPQHIAEQGSEAYEQSLSLNLAAEDRRLIREIDAALERIDKGTFGICEMTGKAINRERLEELPWTRYSIEAAREFERRSPRR